MQSFLKVNKRLFIVIGTIIVSVFTRFLGLNRSAGASGESNDSRLIDAKGQRLGRIFSGLKPQVDQDSHPCTSDEFRSDSGQPFDTLNGPHDTRVLSGEVIPAVMTVDGRGTGPRLIYVQSCGGDGDGGGGGDDGFGGDGDGEEE
jgi:hypothetical protein